jgi:transposase-like protein
MDRIERFWARVVKGDGCWEWGGARNRAGYGKIMVQRAVIPAHRFSWQLTNGPIPEGLYVLHTCDNPPCVNPAHLFVGTHSDNMADMVAKGRDRGNRHVSAESARLIREANFRGVEQSEIAREFGIAQTTVSHIVRGSTHTRAGGPILTTETHCRNGHPRTPENTYAYRGTRNCRLCIAASQRRCKARRSSRHRANP